MSKELMGKLEEYMKASGVDVLGIGSKARFEGLDERLNPFTIFPEGETVLLVGKRICRGSLRGVEEGTNFIDYSLFGSSWLEDEFLSIACYDLTRVLEDEGYEAVPIFPNPTEISPQGVSVDGDKAAPNVHPDFSYAAVACGVAEISYNELIFTPQFGSRQRFHMVITDAVIEEKPIQKQPVCDQCMKCADACPLGAISKTESTEVKVCGKTMNVAKIDYSLCAACKNGASPNRLHPKGKPDRIAALCNRACLSHLETDGRVSNRFVNPFLQRETWARDILGKPVSQKE